VLCSYSESDLGVGNNVIISPTQCNFAMVTHSMDAWTGLLIHNTKLFGERGTYITLQCL
jgi:hypothetical protein